MKRIALLTTLILLLAGTAWAGSTLTCTPVTGITVYAVEADGILITDQDPETPLIINATPEGALWYPIPEGMGPGPHTFRAMCCNADNWWSDWSEPYTATKPNKPFGLKLTLTLEITQ